MRKFIGNKNMSKNFRSNVQWTFLGNKNVSKQIHMEISGNSRWKLLGVPPGVSTNFDITRGLGGSGRVIIVFPPLVLSSPSGPQTTARTTRPPRYVPPGLPQEPLCTLYGDPAGAWWGGLAAGGAALKIRRPLPLAGGTACSKLCRILAKF